ncbi:MAG: glutamine synthetase family protein [Candidatus Hodarchaeales archaeon]
MSEAEKLIQTENVKEIALQFVDIVGILHTLWVPSKLFSKVIEGIHTDGSSLSNMVDVSKSDLKLVPDVNSFKILPRDLFPQRVARVMCNIYEPESDNPFILDPRFILKKAVEDIRKELGSSVNGIASSEIEFFLLERAENGDLKLIDNAGYLASPPADRGAELRIEMNEEFGKIGIEIEKHHAEVPHGKSEFNIKFSNVMEMADTIYLIKFLIKLMAAKKGFIASFMPKPFHWEYGAGLHTHINLKDEETNSNLFSDPDKPFGLSQLAMNFMGGILSHAKALACITNPSVNSYKRLVPGWEAPVYISWANHNRSTLIRIPPGKGKGTRLEYRPTDGSCNFYLAYAGLLSAGLDGIRKKTVPPEAVEENIYKMSDQERNKRGISVLPGNLGEAISELSRDRFFEDAFGREFYENISR